MATEMYHIGEFWKFELRGEQPIYYTGKILAVSESHILILDKFGQERILNINEIRQAWRENNENTHVR